MQREGGLATRCVELLETPAKETDVRESNSRRDSLAESRMRGSKATTGYDVIPFRVG